MTAHAHHPHVRPAAKKIDLYAERPLFFKAKPTPQLVDLPAVKYLSIEGRGEPGGEAFQAAIGAMYAVAFTTKMRMKQKGYDFRVSTLEGLWWSDDPSVQNGEPFLSQDRASWRWRLLMMVPDFVDDAALRATKAELASKKKDGRIEDVALLTMHEGRCVQALHVGPYATEPETMEKMQALMRASGLRAKGKHHEIYLGDPRRAAPEKLKTILRMPVEAAPE